MSNNRESEQHSWDQTNAERSEVREPKGSTQEDAQELGNNCQNQQSKNSGTTHDRLLLPDRIPRTSDHRCATPINKTRRRYKFSKEQLRIANLHLNEPRISSALAVAVPSLPTTIPAA